MAARERRLKLLCGEMDERPQFVQVGPGDELLFADPTFVMYPMLGEALGAQMQVQTNLLSVGISTNWSGVTGSTGVNAISVPIDPANPCVFLR
jgi:histidinol-phosphate/aromatic aminotransferase/cobyric acid decarboxylase-like protein